MTRRAFVGAVAIVAAAVVSAVTQAASPRPQVSTPAASPGPELRLTITRYCVGCHNERAQTSATASGVVLDRLDLARVAADAEVWEKVVRKLRTGAMPPAGAPRPDHASHDALVSWLETTLDRAAAASPNPGRPALHRLNRAEYANAVRDLLALDVDTAALLPPDDAADGFDNNADILGVSPALLERYLSAAGKISALAVGDPAIGPSSEAYRVRGDASQTQHDEELPLGTRGGLLAHSTFPLDGEYVIRVKLLEINLGAVRGLEYPHQLEITIDGERVHLAPVGGPEDYTASTINATNVVNALGARLQVRVKAKAGPHAVGAAFLQKTAAQGGHRLQNFQRSTLIATDHLGVPHIESLTITGPFNASGPGDTPSRRRIFVCRPTKPAEEHACAKTIVSTLARRAYRRPVTDAELAGLIAFYETGRRPSTGSGRAELVEAREGNFERGIELALRSILVSPKFIFRVERDSVDRAPGSTASAKAPASLDEASRSRVQRISDLDLASRLSFFLWSSIPDDELLEIASQGRLRAQTVVAQQVRRMLADPRSQALVGNFAGQWLHVRNLRSAGPDKNEFPDFDDNLRRAFARELELFFESIIREDRNVLDLLTADYTFVNERLARHYRIPNVYGSHFRRVTLTDEARRGLLGKGGILLVTSHADRTSPVVRGKWILDNLVGSPPPPPPANVPPLEDKAGARPLTMRERMEAHRANPACASCHKIMDPLGLALEHFDAVGAWRDREGGSPIDASGQLADGTNVDGVVTLRQGLLKRPEVLVGTMTEKLLTYALGRGLEYYDMPALRAIVRESARDGYRFSSLILGVVNSTPFQMRKMPER